MANRFNSSRRKRLQTVVGHRTAAAIAAAAACNRMLQIPDAVIIYAVPYYNT
jgi:hypothetical protein